MRSGKVLSVLLGLLLVYMAACPLVEAVSRSFSTHDCHGEQAQQTGSTTIFCCREAAVPVSKVQLSKDHSVIAIVPQGLNLAGAVDLVPLFSSPPAPIYLKNCHDLTVLSILRI